MYISIDLKDNIRYPVALQPGATIGIAAPSGPVQEQHILPGIAAIERRGYQVVIAPHCFEKHGFLAGSDENRTNDLNYFFESPDIDAIFCARGGYGSVRLLDHLRFEGMRIRPRPFLGFSDITVLHLALQNNTGLITFYGPMLGDIGKGLSPEAECCLWNTLENPLFTGKLFSADVQTLSPGVARGRLTGGCLALLASSVGTPEEPDFTDRLVLLEDVGEAVYRVDRMLMQLERANLLSKAAGFIIGTVTGCEDREMPIKLHDIWQERIGALGVPAVTGFHFGHIDNPFTLPLGCMAELNADTGGLRILEPAVLSRS